MLKTAKERKKGQYFFANAAQKSGKSMQEKDTNSEAVQRVESDAQSTSTENNVNNEEDATSTQFSSERSTPAQEKASMKIDNMTKQIEAYNLVLSSGIGENREKTKKALKSLKEEREKALKRKMNLQKETERERNYRAAKKKKSRRSY